MKKNIVPLVIMLMLIISGIALAAPQILAPSTNTPAPGYIGDHNAVLSRVMECFPVVEGLVVAQQGDSLYVDLGEGRKAVPGLELKVFRPGEDFKHPISGEVLGKIEKDLGIIRIKEVREKFSVCEILQKAEGVSIAPGDKVRISSSKILLAVGLTQDEGTKADLRSISRQLQSALTRANRFEILDEGRLKNAMTLLGIGGFENLSDPNVAKKLAKELRVQAVLVGRITKTSTIEYLDIKVTSTQSGEVLTSFSADLVTSAPRSPYPTTQSSRSPYEYGAARSAPGSTEQTQRSLPNEDFVTRGPTDNRNLSKWKTPDFDVPMRAMVVADVNGDGKNEIVLADDNQVYIYAWEGSVFRRLWVSDRSRASSILALDAVDLKGTGTPQIVVTQLYGDHLSSFILEHDSKTKKFKTILGGEPYFFRALPTGEGGKGQLYGQMMNISTQTLNTGAKIVSQEPFNSPIYHMVWKNNKLEKGPALKTPTGVGIYGVTIADVDADGANDIVAIDDNEYLRIYSMEGKLKWKSSDHFGGSALFFQYRAHGTITGEKDLRAYIKGRVLARDWEKKGRPSVIVAQNVPKIGYFLENTRLYDKGKIANLTWQQMGLETDWETKDLQGVITDIALADIDGDGVEDLMVLMLYPSYLDWDIRPWAKGTSTVLFYKMSPVATGSSASVQ